MLDDLEAELIESKKFAKSFLPGPAKLLAPEAQVVAKVYGVAKKGVKYTVKFAQGESPSDIASSYIGETLGGKVIGRLIKHPQRWVMKAHLLVDDVPGGNKAKPMLTTRSWITKPSRQKMVIVFHDANRAGPHIDVHIGTLSVVYRVKPDLYEQLKYNREGYLTQKSQALLIQHVRDEIQNGSRVPQNLDHTATDARTAWVKGDTTSKEYGSGATRQVIAEAEVDVFKAGEDRPIEFYAPLLCPHRPVYIHKLYEGTDKRAPILVWGVKKFQPPEFEDRLHLKLIHPEDLDKLDLKADMSTSTAKYDGASCYILFTPKGTTVWSPRKSKVTGEQIDYTTKIHGLAEVKTEQTTIAMGEILFYEKGHPGYLPAGMIGGILNSNMVLPENLVPEIRLYRVDRVGRKRVLDLPFWENRELQKELAKLDSKHLKVAALMSPEEAKARGFEGVVAVPRDAPITQGYKVKWWSDANDWAIERVAFKPGPRGGIAGVVWCVSLDSHKTFKLGPGQVGNHELCQEMMDFPERWEGTVLKVESRHGHEGRAAKVKGIHPDKGTNPF